MRISSKTDYALRTVIDLALHRTEGVVRAGSIAERQSLSRDYLGQILMSLKAAGMVNSKRGLAGGYMLAKDPSEITLLSVIELTDPSLVSVPVESAAEVENVEKSVVVDIWKEVTGRVAGELGSITIQDICDRIAEKTSGQASDYAI
jgi:Rrf2 family cysteine metabolism transcriptional repressor